MLGAVTESLTTVIGWVGTTVDALVATDGALTALLPLMAVGIAVSALSFAISGIRSIVWGA